MKPLTIKVQEVEEQLIDVINKSELSAYILKIILNNLLTQINNIEAQEIENYNKLKGDDK